MITTDKLWFQTLRLRRHNPIKGNIIITLKCNIKLKKFQSNSKMIYSFSSTLRNYRNLLNSIKQRFSSTSTCSPEKCSPSLGWRIQSPFSKYSVPAQILLLNAPMYTWSWTPQLGDLHLHKSVTGKTYLSDQLKVCVDCLLACRITWQV